MINEMILGHHVELRAGKAETAPIFVGDQIVSI